MEKDLYKVLGVDSKASADDIKSAYRQLAKKYHPDKFATASDAQKKEAEEKFKEVQHAYDVLSDPQKKAAYDQFGDENGPTMGNGSGFGDFSGFSGFGGFGNDFFSDIFSAFRGSGRSSASADRDGEDLECVLDLTFKEAVFGVKDKKISFTRTEKCGSCHGSGAKDPGSIRKCQQCNGSGKVRIQQRTPFGVIQTERPCGECGGRGKIITEKCKTCSGRGLVKNQATVGVLIPAGVANGQMLTKRGEGNAGLGAGSNGNLTVVFRVAEHPLFKRDGADVHIDVPITFTQAILGDTIKIPYLDGTMADFNVPAGTQNGTVKKLRGKGIKHLNRESYGDLLVRIVVDIPQDLSSKQKNAIKELVGTMEKAKYENIEKYNKLLKDI